MGLWLSRKFFIRRCSLREAAPVAGLELVWGGTMHQLSRRHFFLDFQLRLILGELHDLIHAGEKLTAGNVPSGQAYLVLCMKLSCFLPTLYKL